MTYKSRYYAILKIVLTFNVKLELKSGRNKISTMFLVMIKQHFYILSLSGGKLN